MEGAAAVVAHLNRSHHALEGAAAAHSSRSHHAVEGAAIAHSSRSHHAAEGTAGAPAAAATHSSRSHHAADGTVSTSTAVTAHSSRSHHTTDGAVTHSSRSHHATDAATASVASAASAVSAAHSSRSHHMDSTAAATAAAVHSSRSHHGQQEKQDEKKTGAVAGPSTSRATAIDYREYREKKERERLEREKAAAAIGCHVADPNKPHHSHHHKQVSNASIPSKHQMPAVQKGTGLHHNHHHRPDMKVGQPVPQRHSTGSQPNRDPSRQRLPREHSMTSTSAGIAHPSYHTNLDSSSSESIPHRSDSGAAQDATSSAYGSLQEKMSNNHSGHRLNALDSKHQAHDKRYRGEDPRLKSAKYADMNRIENQRRKAETLEQRCEEVRKLIEKPLPPPKQADIPYLINAQQKQQAHHAKYNQQQQEKGSSFTGDMKHVTTASQNVLPQGTSPSASSSQKTVPVKTQMYSQHTAQGVSQILKDTIKNGNSQSCLSTLNNVDDTKLEKRSRSTAHEEFADRNSVDVQQGNLHTPPGKHRSLFSPEPPIVSRDLQGARLKLKQKTPPSAASKIKERVSPFASSPTLQDSLTLKRPPNDGVVPTHKRTRASSIGENEQPVKMIKQEIKTEDTTSLEAMKMLGRVPDLIQPIRDNPSSSNSRNSSASSIINDLKPPELIKPFESDQPRFNMMSQHKVPSMNVNALTNGMDLNVVVKQELPEHRVKREPLEHYIKKEPSGHKAPEPTHSQPQIKLEYTSPIKSAQSISALLQETLAPMPSLLQGLQQSTQVHQEQLQHQQQQHQLQSIQHSLMDHQLPVTTQCLSIASDNFTPIASTVDISVLSDNVSMTLPSNMMELTAPAVSTITAVPPVEEKRSEHHKSEKKKKKEKHKHKDKEKSKEKHKHKHKDKDKEKHREKKDKEKSEETLAAAPIKITIPKDKLNLSTEASSTVVGGGPGSLDKNISPQNTGLKIKIPKERLKGTDSVPSSSPAQPPMLQGPLKIKIRTDGISRSSAAAPPPLLTSSSSNGSSGSLHMFSELSANETTNRKRERAEMIGDSSGSSGLPLTKKQALMIPAAGGYGQSHRPGERQNGRHYNSGSNNKVRGRGVRQHHGGRGPPPHHAVAGQRGNAGGHYQREIYGNGRGNRGHQHYLSHQSHHPPAVRGDVGGYARGTGHADQGTDSYFYANYPASMFSTPAGYMYDPAYQQYYQQFQQSQYPMYPAGGNLIMTPDGTINTSVPPPSLLPNHLYQNQNIIHSQSAVSTRQEDAQLLPPPPLQPPPSPPPLPSGPPPPPPPPPPPSTSE